MIVRSLHLDDRGGIAHVDVRMTAEEARLLVDISAALATALGQQPPGAGRGGRRT
jgi:hypothetical protein